MVVLPGLLWLLSILPGRVQLKRVSRKKQSGLLWLLFILFASYIVMGLLVGVLVETVSTVATLEREQLDIDFAQKVLWEMIDKGGADEDGDNRISETEYVNLLSRQEAVKSGF